MDNYYRRDVLIPPIPVEREKETLALRFCLPVESEIFFMEGNAHCDVSKGGRTPKHLSLLLGFFSS